MANRCVFILRCGALRLDERRQPSRRGFEEWILTSRRILQALATELTSTLSTLLIKRLRLGNGQPTYRHGTGTSRIASERYEDTFASDYSM
ncbi:hypothetical protein TNCV_2927521 [Trichonephila clavipes]|nr:hypothetical protein TNCV_2927521 [Trichonephila clavipes]